MIFHMFQLYETNNNNLIQNKGYKIQDKLIYHNNKMQCESHKQKKVTHKCRTCQKYLCLQCSKSHRRQKHEIITSIELAQIIKQQISSQVQKMNLKMEQLTAIRDYQVGETIIVNCMNEILQFVRSLFQSIKKQYRNIVDLCWKRENIDAVNQIQGKKQVLEEWLETVIRRPEQATVFDAQKIYEANKIQDQQQQVKDYSQSCIVNNLNTRIMFNQTALRRTNESLTKIIYTQTKQRQSSPKKLKKAGNNSKKLIQFNPYISLCKFVQGTNILYEYIINDPDLHSGSNSNITNEEKPMMIKVQFREFVVPFRSVCVVNGSHVYLIGGCNKENVARKQIMYFERAYTTMRVIGLLKQARVSHAVCVHEDGIYTFGGKRSKSLQVFNTKTKVSKILHQFTQQILGASLIALNQKLYIIGGTDTVEQNSKVYMFNILSNNLQVVQPYNSLLYTMPISPILQSISQTQILIIGGYHSYIGKSYNNSYILLYDTRMNYYTVFDKGQLIYPIIGNGNNSVFRDGKVIALCELKRCRSRHGPNLGVIFECQIGGEEDMHVDFIGY